jgi:K+-transporting ATPase ATPase C chain
VIRTLTRPVLAVVAITAAFGFAYPLVITGIAQLFFSGKASGSLVAVEGSIVGSRLAAQGFSKSSYFHPRPSATTPAYNAAGTTFANLGPTNPDLASQVSQRASSILKLEQPYNPGLTIAQIPVDAVTTSGSGIDPEISPAYAQLQSRRVAAVRGLPLSRVEQLIDDATEHRSLGFLGEPGVNVLELNLALDREGQS